MADTTPAAIEALLKDVTPGPWSVDGPPWNQIIWSGAENRLAYMAHSNGLDDARDIATARFIAAARDLVPALAAELTAARQERDAGAKDYCALMERHDAEFVRAEKAEAEAAGLREAIAYVLDGHGLNAPDFKRQPEDDEDNWIVSHLRATLTHNWRDDSEAIVEDNEIMIGRDYE